jgi:hypothetical protein
LIMELFIMQFSLAFCYLTLSCQNLKCCENH